MLQQFPFRVLGLSLLVAGFSSAGDAAVIAPGTSGTAPKVVASHAYLYKPRPGIIGPKPQETAAVLVTQPGKAELLHCALDQGTKLPSTPQELEDFINGGLGVFCFDIIPGSDPARGYYSQSIVIYQAKSERFLFLDTLMIISKETDYHAATVISGSGMVVFDPSNKETLNILDAGLYAYNGANPKIGTNRNAETLYYDADVNYREITLKPIEQ